MATNRVNTAASEFRTILTRIKEVKDKLEQTDNVELATQLGEVNDSLRIMEGNQTDFADAVFKVLDGIQSKVADGFKAMEARIGQLEAKMEPILEASPSTDCSTPSPTSTGRKRKISRHPDLSHYVRSKMDQMGLSWNTDKKENEDPNRDTSVTLLKEIREIDQIKNDSCCTERRVRDAISQNYSSCKKRKRQELNGTYEKYQLEQKRRQRIKRKLEKRMKALSEEDRNGDMFEALNISLISSDESGTENDDVLVTRPLTWRTDQVSEFFKLLDGRSRSSMTAQQKRQSVNRRLGLPSERNSSGVPQHLLWAVRIV